MIFLIINLTVVSQVKKKSQYFYLFWVSFNILKSKIPIQTIFVLKFQQPIFILSLILVSSFFKFWRIMITGNIQTSFHTIRDILSPRKVYNPECLRPIHPRITSMSACHNFFGGDLNTNGQQNEAWKFRI